jgi:hypothetical protein
MKIIGCGLLFSLSVMTVIVSARSSADRHQSVKENLLDKSEQELIRVVESKKDIVLFHDVISKTPEVPTTNIYTYVFPWLPVIFVQECNWVLRPDQREKHVSGLEGLITVESAQMAIKQYLAFEELTRRNSDAVWKILVENKDNPTTLLDIFIAAKILWGDKIQVLPKEYVKLPSIDEQPLPSPKWSLPVTSTNNWLAIYHGKNPVFRMLAILAAPEWASKGMLESEMVYGLKNKVPFVREEALSLLRKMPIKYQERVLLKYFERPLSNTDKGASKIVGQNIASYNATLKAQLQYVEKISGLQTDL